MTDPKSNWAKGDGGRARRLSRRGFLEAAGGAGIVGAMTFVVPAVARGQESLEPIKIGVMGPFTGPASRTGDSIQKGAQMALDDAHAAGRFR